MTNFTIQDTIGAAVGIAGFGAILLAPGYLLAWSLDLFAFRSRSLLERLAWANALSFALAPIVTQLAGLLLPLRVIAFVFALAAMGMLGLVFADWRNLRLPVDRQTVLLGLFLLFGTAVIVFELVDIQRGSRLFLSVTVADQGFRVAFINAIAHTGIPPRNPLYHPGSAGAPLRYYYFWYALCAVCMKLAGVSARQALIASSVWTGLGLVAAIALFARHFFKVRERMGRFLLIASLLLTVTGLDIVPGLYNLFFSHDCSADLEWWSRDQISSWMDSILWVPNHTAALLACLIAFLLLWQTRDPPRDGLARRNSIPAALLAGFAAASAFGMSVYVAFGFALLMVGWTAILWFRERDFALARRNGVAVLTASALLIPYLRELTASHSGTQSRTSAAPSHLFQISVRAMIDPDLVTSLPVFAVLQRTHPVLLDQAVRLVLLLPGYALELGAFGMVLVLALIAHRQLERSRRTALALAVGGLFLVSFLRSSVIGNNDFGYRAALLPCFFLLLLTADYLSAVRPRMQRLALSILLFAGVVGTAFQALLLRVFTSTAFQALLLRVFIPLHVDAGAAQFAGLPEAAFAARTAYSQAATVIPPEVLVQSNPVDPRSYLAAANLLYSQRAMVTDAEADCGAVFGGDPAGCAETREAVEKLFASVAPSPAQVVERCRALGISYLAVAQKDPAWEDRRGWVWTLPEISASSGGENGGESSASGFRIVGCTNGFGGLP